MGGPVGVGAAYGVVVVEGGGGGACVGWFKGVDAGGLDRYGKVGEWVVHCVYDHACDLGGDYIIGDSVGDLAARLVR